MTLITIFNAAYDFIRKGRTSEVLTKQIKDITVNNAYLNLQDALKWVQPNLSTNYKYQ